MPVNKIFKLIFIGLGAFGLLFGLAIFIFGSNDRLQTELPPTIPILKTESLPISTAKAAENLTDAFGEQLAKEIISKNQAGPQLLEAKSWLEVADPNSLAAELLGENIPENIYAELVPNISAVPSGELIVVGANGKNDLEIYLKKFNELIAKNLSGLSLDKTNIEQSNFPALISARNNLIAELKLLPVPSSLVTILKKEISLLIGEKNILLALANYQTDPLRTMLAAQASEKLALAFSALTSEILGFINKYNLAL